MTRFLTLLLLLAAAAPAAPAGAEVRFTGGPVARVPFQIRSHHVLMRGTVNGDSVWIVVDTGAGASVMDDGLARRLGLETRGEARALGAGGAVAARQVSGVTIGLPGLEIRRDEITALPLADVAARGGHPMEVIVGHELFERSVVVLDYAAGVMEVHDSRRSRPPARGVAVPLTFENRHPYIEAEIVLPGGVRRSGRFVLDTGSSRAVMLSAGGAERDRLVAALPRTLVGFGRGVGGEVRSVVGRAESLRIGTLAIPGPIVAIPAPGAGQIAAPGTAGNIGGEILGRHRVTFDYASRRVWFEPGTRTGDPFETDMSGAAITREADGFTVRSVVDDSPAHDAGLREGDIVLALNGRPAESFSLWELRQSLQGDGRIVTLEVLRAGVRRQLELRLRRLI